MATALKLRQIPRNKLFEVFKTQEQVDLYESLLRNAGDLLPLDIQNALDEAALAMDAAELAQITADGALNAANFALAQLQFRQLKENLVGQVAWFACNAPPPDWLECNGAVVLASDYPELFTRIGATFGGNGTTTFGLPNLQGEFVRGWDHGRGVDPGRTFGSFQADDFKSHAHTVSGANSWLNTTGGGGVDNVPGTDFSAGASIILNNTGGPETRPRNIALLPCIHY